MKHARDLSRELPVASMQHMPAMAVLVSVALRGWSRGGPGAALAALRARMPEGQAAGVMAAMCDLAGILGTARRRPPACPGAECLCAGADEATFARFVQEAALGNREDALLLASLMVDASAITGLTDAAQRFGLQLYRATLRDSAVLTAKCPAGTTVH